MWMKIGEAAVKYKCKRQWLQQLCGEGKIKFKQPGGKGKRVFIDTDSADEFMNLEKKPPSKPKNKPQENELTPEKRTGNPPDSPAGLTIMSKADYALKMTKITALKIKNDQSQNSLIDRKQTEDLFFMIARNVRDALESIPSRAATICVGKTRHEIEQILIEEVKQAESNLVLNL